MSNNRLKKLRTLTSLETDCTFEDNYETPIRINIHQPTNRNTNTHSTLQPSIRETASEEDLPAQNNLDRKLMSIPELSKRHGDTCFLQSSNNSEPLRESANSKTYLKRSKNQAAGEQQSVVRIEGSGLVNNSLSSYDIRTSNKNINKPINSKGQTPQTLPNVLTDSLTHSAPFGSARSGLRMDKNCDFLLEVSSNQSGSDHEQINLDLEDQKTLKIHVHNVERRAQNPTVKNQTRPPMKRQPLPAAKSERFLTVKEERSTSRMKLRDYIYMTQASSSRASIDRHQLTQNRKTSPVPAAIPPRTQPAVAKKQEEPSGGDQYPLVAPSARRQYVNAKYKISNSQMFQILKKEICQDIAAVEANLKRTAEELEDVETSGKEPTNDELLVLYNMRREVKEQIAKRVQLALDSLLKNKGSNLLRSRRKSEDHVVEELTCSQFLSKHP